MLVNQNAVYFARTCCILLACVAWRFWLGALSNKGGRGQRNREEIGAGVIFLAASPLVLARFARKFRGYAAPAPHSTKPPCYAGWYPLCKQYDHIMMLSKNQPAHSPGIHLINLCANGCKFINHGIKPSGQ